MMYVEYDWTFNVYRVRAGQTFTDWRGQYSFESLDDVRTTLSQSGCKLGKKTDSRTWPIETADMPDNI